jgi:peroxiredoxin
MGHGKRRRWIGLILAMAVGAAGCGGSDEPAKPADSGATAGRGGPAGDVGRPAPSGGGPATVAPPVLAPTIPEVHLTEQDQRECFVLVGDMMPPIELADLDGNTSALADLYGEKATVVFFWKVDGLFTTTQLEDLGLDFAAPRADQGVKVVGVAVDEEAAVREIVGQAQPGFPNLLDSGGEALAKVGTAVLMPRIYLLDAQGKILWFDVEFSQSTTRELTTALDVMVGAGP